VAENGEFYVEPGTYRKNAKYQESRAKKGKKAGALERYSSRGKEIDAEKGTWLGRRVQEKELYTDIYETEKKI